MAITTGVMIFLLASVLMATTMVSSIEDKSDTQTQNYHHGNAPSIAPMHPPKKQPIHHSRPPVNAPAHAPAKPPTYIHGRQTKAPAHPPAKATAPVPFFAPKNSCVPLCLEYCRGHASKRMCMRTCTACCSKCKCVPIGQKKCSNWDHVNLHGAMIKCP